MQVIASNAPERAPGGVSAGGADHVSHMFWRDWADGTCGVTV
jgi:hypothetical protein